MKVTLETSCGHELALLHFKHVCKDLVLYLFIWQALSPKAPCILFNLYIDKMFKDETHILGIAGALFYHLR